MCPDRGNDACSRKGCDVCSERNMTRVQRRDATHFSLGRGVMCPERDLTHV